MAKSMTGYGRGKATLHDREITVEIRSVNHRYLDCTIKYPRMYGYLEDAIKTYLGERINRGKVDVFVSIDTSQSAETKISWNRPLAQSYLNALRDMGQQLEIKDDISIMSLSRWTELFSAEKIEASAEELTQDVLIVLAEALEPYEQMRCKEGATLCTDISNRLDTILSLVEQIEKRSPQSLEEYRQRLLTRMQEVLGSTMIEPQRILTEAALFADRVAVDEETVRLRSHMQQLKNMLQETVPTGRKLDFLVQEFNREANTIGSKGNDLQIARLVVDLKAEIEKIREQVQNME